MSTTRRARLVARDIGAGYGGPPVFEHLDLTLASGDAVGLVGRSGVGKSTLLEVLAGRFPATTGSVALDGRRVHRPGLRDRKQVRARLRLVHQNGFTGNDPLSTVGRMLRAAQDVARAAGRQAPWEPAQALAQVDLPERFLDRRFGTLSGGERQRVVLVQALGADPDLLLLDEPFTAVDPGMRRELADDLAAYLADAGVGLLVASHDTTLLDRLTTTVHLLTDDGLVGHGPLRDVLAADHADARDLADALAASARSSAESLRRPVGAA